VNYEVKPKVSHLEEASHSIRDLRYDRFIPDSQPFIEQSCS